jgi:DNA-binding transcriptional LysR family regulator
VKNLNTRYLEYAIEIERVGSISRAAKRFYMNQPHLSKAIREFEENLGITIFKRTPKGMVPTKKGSEFLAYAKSILAQIGMMEQQVGRNRSPKMTFNIAVPRASYIAYAFTEFLKTLPTNTPLAIDYREANSVRVVHDVADGENDLGIVRFPAVYENYFIDFLQEKNLDFEPISHFEYLALFSEHHPLAKEKLLNLTSLEEYVEIVHGDTNVPSLARSKKFLDREKTKKEIAVYERGSQLEILARLPLTYMWVSPMPEVVLSTFSLVQRRCNMPKNYQKDYLIYRNEYHFADEDVKFIFHLKKVVKEVLFFQEKQMKV